MNLVTVFEKLMQLRLHREGFESSFHDSEHGKQHVYTLAGSGPLPPIVLFHGIGASASAYAPLMRRLSRHCQKVMALDLPGHGLSAPMRNARGYRLLFDAGCEIARSVVGTHAIVFGNSMGGAFALEFCRRHPELVQGLVLCSPAGAPMDAELLKRFLARFVMEDGAAAREFLHRIYARPPWFLPVLSPFVRHIFSSPTVRGILEELRPGEGATRADLQALTMPLLLIWGKRDGLMPPEQLQFFRDNLPSHARIVEPERFGHCPQLDEISAVGRLIVDFASEVQAQRQPSRVGLG